ncbi:MSHA fimbrial biogenesis protein MshJ [Rhodocyclaceae bacterium]
MARTQGMQQLKQTWQGWAQRFAALQPREKYLVVGALLFAVGFGGYSLWIEPAQLQKARLTKSIAQQQNEQTELQAQLLTLAKQDSDPDAANRAALAQVQQALADADRDIHGFDGVLVSPQQAPVLLQTLLGRHRGLTLVSLATLPPQPLIAPPAEKKAVDGKPAEAQPAPGAPPAPEAAPEAGSNIFKHGIEIKIAGSYSDLLAYVNALETGPQKLLWGGMSLSSQYPVSELTLTVYTLSLESIWLTV